MSCEIVTGAAGCGILRLRRGRRGGERPGDGVAGLCGRAGGSVPGGDIGFDGVGDAPGLIGEPEVIEHECDPPIDRGQIRPSRWGQNYLT